MISASHSMSTERCMFYEQQFPQMQLHLYVWERDTHTHTHTYAERVSNEQIFVLNPARGLRKRQKYKERLVYPGRGDKVKYQILCLSLMTQDPHGREGKPRSERDMMNPETDNLKPPNSQPTHTHRVMKTCLRNQLHSSETTFSVFSLLVFLVTVSAFFSVTLSAYNIV